TRRTRRRPRAASNLARSVRPCYHVNTGPCHYATTVMRIEILGSGGAIPTPRAGCSCAVCVEARAKGVPYARTGPSVFVHDLALLIDTPEESNLQLNRAGITRVAAALYSHWHPDHTAGRRIFETLNLDFRAWPRHPETTDVY